MRPLHILLAACLFSFTLMGCKSGVQKAEATYPKGGYDYPKSNSNVDTTDYSMPIRNLKTLKDSFFSSYYGRYWGQGYNEPNLSLRPMGKDVFRLVYEEAFGYTAIITLVKNEIVVKQTETGTPFPDYDTTRLSPLERFHFQVLSWAFPIQEKQGERNKKVLDSLVHIYPQLLQPSYYRYLLDKSAVLAEKPFKYSTATIPINQKQYETLVEMINASEFWQLPHEIQCKNRVMDGFGFILEANTAQKYNHVSTSTCPGESNKFRLACQELVKHAGLEKKIQLISDGSIITDKG